VILDREQRAQFRAKLQLQRRPGRLTLACVAIGKAMLDLVGRDGRLDPSIGHLAALVGVAPSTVTRGLARLRACGFLDWARRLIRCADTGWRAAQDTNAYWLMVPACDAHFAALVLQGLKVRDARGAREKQEAADQPTLPLPQPTTAELTAARAALEARARFVETRLASRWVGEETTGIAIRTSVFLDIVGGARTDINQLCTVWRICAARHTATYRAHASKGCWRETALGALSLPEGSRPGLALCC
jgi:hypothetical protein